MVNAFTSFRFPGISGQTSWQSTSKLSYFEAKKVPKIHKFESRILILSKKIRFWMMKYMNMRERKMTSIWKYISPNIIDSGQFMLETNLESSSHIFLLKSLNSLKLAVKYIPYTWIKFDNNFFWGIWHKNNCEKRKIVQGDWIRVILVVSNPVPVIGEGPTKFRNFQ